MNRDRFLRNVLPVLLWMGVIFTLSTKTGSATHTDSFLDTFLARYFSGLFHHLTWPELDAVHYYVRKAAHVTEYAILGVLMVRALPKTWTPAARRFLYAWFLCTLYAATDEFHQIFVPGRTPKVTDVCLDSFGTALGVVLTWVVVRRQRQSRFLSPVPPLEETP